MPSGEKKKVPPIFAYVTQGRTDHLVVITDPTILTMIKDLGPTGWTLDQMPDQDSTFIQIKWNNTGTKQPVVVSSVKLMDEGDYGRPLPAGAGTSGRSGRSSSASTRRRSSSRSATTTTTTAATTGKGGAGTTGTAGAAAATTGKSGAAPATTSSTSSSSSAHPPLKKRRMLAAAAAAQAAEEAQQQAAKTNPHPTDEEQEKAAKEQDEHTKTATEEEIATQKQKKQQAEAAKQQQLQLQAEETAKKLQMKQQQEKEEAAKAAAKKDEDSKNAVAAAAAAQKNAADKAAVAKKDEEAQAAAAAKKDEDVKAAAASTKQQQQEQQAAKTKAATAMDQKIKKDRDDAKLKAEAAAFLKQQEEEKEAAEAVKVLAAAKAKKEEAAAKEQKWFEAQQAKEAAEEVARQKQQKQNEEQERKTRLLAEVRAKAAAQQLAAEQKQQQADAAAKLAREVAKLKQQEAENKKKVHQAEQIKQEDDGLDDSDAFASDEEEDPTPAESKIPRKARTTVASSATHARSSFTNLGALSYPGGNQHSGSTGTAAAGAAGTADQGGGGSDGRDRSGSTTGGGGNGNGDQQPPPSKRFKSEEEGEYVGGNGNTNDGSGGNSDGNNNSGGGGGGGYEVSGADISDADKFNILMWEGNFMAAERLAEYQGRRRTDDLSFLYGYIVLDYLKHRLGYTSMKELDCTLIKALQANPFVPTYLTMIRMGDPIPPYDNHGYDVGERNEALYYVSSTEVVEVWQHIPGLLTWLEQTSNMGGTSKPPDDGRILFDLMSKGMMLVDVDPPNYGGNGADAVLTPPKSKKLFVGGIPPDIRQDEYRDFFEQFGELRDWVVKFDGETGNSRGFGFITYVDPDVTAFVTKLGDKREGYGRLVMRGKTVEIKPHRDSRNKLFVGGLPLDVSNAELRDFFQKFGMVVDSIVMVHKDTNIPRGFGFVTYENADVTDFVLRMRDNNYMTNRDGMGRIVMRGSVLEIKEYDTSQDTRSATYAGASPAGKRLRDGGGGGEHRGPERLKVTLNLDHIKGQLPQDYRDVLSIKNYNPSRDLVCLTSDYRRGNPSTSFPYSAVRKVYFWKLLYGSGYFCHEMQHEQQPSKESNAIGYDEEEHHHRPAGHVHPDDQMMIDDRDRDRAPRSPPPPASNLKKNQAHVGEPIHTCEVCGGAHRREKCWDDPRNAHLRPADWVPSATFMAKKGVTPKRPSLSGPYGDDVSVRSGSIAESHSRSAPPGSGGASAKEEPPLKWRPPEDGEKDKRVIDGKPHTYNWQIKGWVDDTTKGFKWRAPDEDENGARVIDNKPHIYNYSIRGWVVDPNYRRGSYSQSERRRSYGDDPRRHTYGGGSGGGGGDDYRRDDNRHRDDDRRGGGGHHGDDRRGSSGGDHYGGGGGGGDRYRDDDHHRGDRDRRHGGGGGGGGSDRYRDEDRGGGYR